MLNVPVPVQPEPCSVQVPEIVLPFAVPDRVSVLPAGVPDNTVNWNWPVTLPLKFPVRANEPLSVPPDTKQGEFVVKVKWLTLSEPSLFTTSEVPKVRNV